MLSLQTAPGCNSGFPGTDEALSLEADRTTFITSISVLLTSGYRATPRTAPPGADHSEERVFLHDGGILGGLRRHRKTDRAFDIGMRVTVWVRS